LSFLNKKYDETAQFMVIVIKLLALKTFIFRKLNICVEKWSLRFLLRGKKNRKYVRNIFRQSGTFILTGCYMILEAFILTGCYMIFEAFILTGCYMIFEAFILTGCSRISGPVSAEKVRSVANLRK